MTDDARQLDECLRRAGLGDVQALAQMFDQYRPQLKRMVSLRLDTRLHGRLDPSDVVQEAYMEASKKFADFTQQDSMPVFLWLRLVTLQKLTDIHRFHGMQKRDTRREVAFSESNEPPASSCSMAGLLVGRYSSPSQVAVRAELLATVQQALEGLDPIDREVLALRHFEGLSNAEAAQVLGIQPNAASNRYVRAGRRLRSALAGIPGFSERDLP